MQPKLKKIRLYISVDECTHNKLSSIALAYGYSVPHIAAHALAIVGEDTKILNLHYPRAFPKFEDDSAPIAREENNSPKKTTTTSAKSSAPTSAKKQTPTNYSCTSPYALPPAFRAQFEEVAEANPDYTIQLLSNKKAKILHNDSAWTKTVDVFNTAKPVIAAIEEHKNPSPDPIEYFEGEPNKVKTVYGVEVNHEGLPYDLVLDCDYARRHLPTREEPNDYVTIMWNNLGGYVVNSAQSVEQAVSRATTRAILEYEQKQPTVVDLDALMGRPFPPKRGS